MNSKYLISVCACSISFACLKAKACPPNISRDYEIAGGITDGVNAELIRNDGGSLLGIRVSWSWSSSVPTDCFQSPVVELVNNTGRIRKTVNIISHNNSVEYFDLVCNQMYTPKVRVSFRRIQQFENGNTLFFGGSKRFPPPILSSLCVGSPTLPEDVTQGRFNISWDPLPCHLQNGADITGYIIQYTHLSTGVATNISNSHDKLLCAQELGGPYSCRVSNSLFNSNEMYSFQVAARNYFGDGSFSDAIIKSITLISQDNMTTCATHDHSVIPDVLAATVGSTEPKSPDVASGNIVTSIEPESIPITTSQGTDSVITSTAATYCTGCICQQVWTPMGSLVAVMAVTAGIVIVVQFIINFALWKRLRRLKKVQTVILPQASTLGDSEIDMKECSAYGQVISPQPITEQTHIYEYTT